MSARISVRCDGAAREAGDVKVFALRLPAAAPELRDAIGPGRYVALEYADMTGVMHQRMYSVTRKAAPDLFEIAVRRTGTRGVADSLHASLREGAAVTLLFAAGDITIESILARRHVFMWAAGIGVTLPIALLRELAQLAALGRPVPRVTLYLCCPGIDDACFLHELLQLDLTCAWFDVQVFVTRQPIHSSSHHFLVGRPSEAMLRALPAPDAVVLCGGHEFAAATRRVVRELYPEAALLIESFSAPPAPERAGTAPHPDCAIAIAGHSASLLADPNKSLLENLEIHQIPIRNQCRSGICGSCRLKIISGSCRRDMDFCLDPKDVSNGYALACCTYPISGQLTIALGLSS